MELNYFSYKRNFGLVKAIPKLIKFSELLIKQLNGEYKISEPRIQKLFIEVWNLKVDFGNVVFIQIPREENKEADKLVNEALDQRGKNKTLF